MTEHFTREEAAALAKAAGFEVRRGLGLRESVPEDVFARGLINEEVTALCNAAVTAIDKQREAQGAVAYLAWKDGKPCYEGDDGVCEEAVWPLDDTDDRTSMPVYTHPLPAQPAEPVNAELIDACGRYEAALMAAFPNGAHGEAFTQWNEARKLLAKRAQAAQPVVVVPYETHLNNMRNAVDIFQSYVNGRTSKYLAQVSINALNEYLDASPLPQQKEG